MKQAFNSYYSLLMSGSWTLNPLPHIDTFWCLCSRWLLKSLWQKEKLLIMSNFSICHNDINYYSIIILSFIEIFYILDLIISKSSAEDLSICGKGLTSAHGYCVKESLTRFKPLTDMYFIIACFEIVWGSNIKSKHLENLEQNVYTELKTRCGKVEIALLSCQL